MHADVIYAPGRPLRLCIKIAFPYAGIEYDRKVYIRHSHSRNHFRAAVQSARRKQKRTLDTVAKPKSRELMGRWEGMRSDGQGGASGSAQCIFRPAVPHMSRRHSLARLNIAESPKKT